MYVKFFSFYTPFYLLTVFAPIFICTKHVLRELVINSNLFTLFSTFPGVRTVLSAVEAQEFEHVVGVLATMLHLLYPDFDDVRSIVVNIGNLFQPFPVRDAAKIHGVVHDLICQIVIQLHVLLVPLISKVSAKKSWSQL